MSILSHTVCDIRLNPKIAFAESEVRVTMRMTVSGNFLHNEGGWISRFVSRMRTERLSSASRSAGCFSWASGLGLGVNCSHGREQDTCLILRSKGIVVLVLARRKLRPGVKSEHVGSSSRLRECTKLDRVTGLMLV